MFRFSRIPSFSSSKSVVRSLNTSATRNSRVFSKLFGFGASLVTFYHLYQPNVLECAPAKLKKFEMSMFTPHNGNIPFPAILLLRQVQPLMDHHFPDLEVPASFPGQADYFYHETGTFHMIWPSGVQIQFPLFERLSMAEEKEIGEAGQRKLGVARCIVIGTCSSACAVVEMKEVQVIDNATDELLWHWRRG